MSRWYTKGIIAGGILLALATRAFCQISWDTTLVQRAASSDAKQVEIDFPFTNRGTQPITFLSIKPLCSCTTIGKMEFTCAPGKRGILPATFTVGDREGLQEKYIDVSTSDSASKTQRLTFRISLPQFATLIPNHLVWKTGDGLSAETMEFTVKQPEPVRILEALSSDNNFAIEVKTIKKGFQYSILVTPLKFIAPLKSDIKIRTDISPLDHRVFIGQAEIQSQSH